MVTIQEFEAHFNAKLMAVNFNQLGAMSQWTLMEKIENIITETIKELGLEYKISKYTCNSTVSVYASYHYAKNELHIKENILQELTYPFNCIDCYLFQIKVQKKKEKVKKDFTGNFFFKNAKLVAEDKTKTIDETIFYWANLIQKQEDEKEKRKQKILEDNREKWRDFYAKTLIDYGLTIQSFQNLLKEYNSLPFISPVEYENILKEFIEKEGV